MPSLRIEGDLMKLNCPVCGNVENDRALCPTCGRGVEDGLNWEKRYGCWAGKPNGTPEDTRHCIEEISGGQGGYSDYISRQCGRKRGYGIYGLYCKQHSKKHEPKPKDTKVNMNEGPGFSSFTIRDKDTPVVIAILNEPNPKNFDVWADEIGHEMEQSIKNDCEIVKETQEPKPNYHAELESITFFNITEYNMKRNKITESMLKEIESLRAELAEIQKHSATTVYLGMIDRLKKENEALRAENGGLRHMLSQTYVEGIKKENEALRAELEQTQKDREMYYQHYGQEFELNEALRDLVKIEQDTASRVMDANIKKYAEFKSEIDRLRAELEGTK